MIKLNVGGQAFVTTEETINSMGPSMLASMIKHTVPAREIDGYYFIDRDPTTFRWILNYLRGSKILPARGTPEIYQLLEEADYFALETLATRIRHSLGPAFDKGDHVLARAKKYTVAGVEKWGFLVTKMGKVFKIDAGECMVTTSIEIGDVVMARLPNSAKRVPGICMGKKLGMWTIECQGKQTECLDSGVRF